MGKKYELLDISLTDRLKLYQRLKHRLSVNYTECLNRKLVNSKHLTESMLRYSVNKLIMKYCLVSKNNKPNLELYPQIVEFKQLESGMINLHKQIIAVARKFKCPYIKLSDNESELLLEAILAFGLLNTQH